MKFNDNKYFSNGALISDIYFSESNKYMRYIFNGYYYNTEIVCISVSFTECEKGAYKPNIYMCFDNGGYTKSPLTTRVFKRIRNLIYEILDCDFGNDKINQNNHIFIDMMSNAFERYNINRHIIGGKETTISACGKEYVAEIYFN